MTSLLFAALVLIVLGLAYQQGAARSRALAGAGRLHSRPRYHGALVALWAAVPLLFVLALWGLVSGALEDWYIQPVVQANVASGDSLATALQRVQGLASGFGVRRVSARLRARNHVEAAVRAALILCSVIAIFTTLGIVLSLLFETLRFFSFVSPAEFFFGTVWQPGYASTGSEATGGYGMVPLLVGTLMIASIAMLVAIPVGLMTAIWLTQYASRRVRTLLKPMIEILAGIPTIVYGFFALVTVGPFLSDLGDVIGLNITATSALTAGLVMGIMIIPFVSSLSDDIIRQVPSAMRDGSLGLGATKSETIRMVIFPAALPGIVGAILLAVSRAIGETMIVVLAAGNAPILRFNPFEATSSFTVTIVAALTGDSDFASPQSLVAFALGLTLFVLTLMLNIGALAVVRRYREQYE